MATSEDVIRFQELSNKDRILCTTRDHTRYLQGSVMVMELIDEIHALNAQIRERSLPTIPHDADMDRSCLLISYLRLYRDRVESELQGMLVEAGEL